MLREFLGATCGWAGYFATRGIVRLRNFGRPRRGLDSSERARYAPLFPDLDLDRIEIVMDASLPANWVPYGPDIEGMAFGYRIFVTFPATERSRALELLLAHELVHVDQVRRRGDSERRFAVDYGRGYLGGGGYASNPLEVEAFRFVDECVRRRQL